MTLAKPLVIRWLVVAASLVGLHASAPRLVAQTGTGTDALGDCSVDSLARAMVIDTSRLLHRTMDLSTDESSEGGTATIYFAADRPRVVNVAYYGDMGRATYRYFLLSPSRYVVQQETVQYKLPISKSSQAQIRSRVQTIIYVCDSQVSDLVTPQDVAKMRATLDSTLARSRRVTDAH